MVDQSTDPILAHLIQRVADRPKLASAVMEIDIDPAELATLPDSAFAWPEKRAYPVHSAGHTLLSRVYREGVDVPTYVDQALKEACEVYGVDEGLFARTKVAAIPESDDVFLLPDIRRMRVTEAGHVKEAEEKLRTEGTKLSVTHRALASHRLVEKAAYYGVNLRAETRKMAGMTVTERQPLVDWLEARREAAPIDYKDSYQKLANEAKRLPDQLRDRTQQIKLAEAIQDLDEQAGLARFYDRKLPDPLRTVFNSNKTAGQGVTLAGRFMPLERLAAYDSNFYSDALGPDIVREASDASGHMDHQRLAQVLETLPIDMQRVLSAQMR